MRKLIQKVIRFFKKDEPVKVKVDVSMIEYQIDGIVFDFINQGKGNALLNFNTSMKYWQSVIKAICFAESNFNRFERFFEDSMGYYSEGLMQLSYQDCPRYNYYLDKSKDEIFDVEKNITLGLIILNTLVKRKGAYIFNDGNYWAVLQPKNKRHKVFLAQFNEYMNR